MSTTSDFDRSAAAWLSDGPTELADRVLDAALREVHLTHQRRRPLAPWRKPTMSFFSTAFGRAGAMAVVAVVAIGGAAYLLGGTATVPGPSQSPSPSQSASPTAKSVERPPESAFTESFRSPLYGYVVKYPKGWVITPATASAPNPATLGDLPELGNPGADSIASGEMVFLVAVTPVPAGTTEAQWSAQVDALVPQRFAFVTSANCPKSTTALVVDGEPAAELAYDVCKIATFMWVTTVHDGYGYQLIWTDYAYAKLADAQGVFDGFLHSFTFPNQSTPSSTFDTSGWVDFTSARVGLSLKFPAGYAVTRATVPWIWRLHDPGPPEGSCDVAEAANHAAFTVCSERLPDSLTEAAWWDDYMQGPDSVPSTNPCFPARRSDFEQVTVEGQIGYSHGGLPQCNFTEVLLVTGGRAYLFNATPNTQVITGTPFDRTILNAWLSTIHFDPASADDTPVASPAASS